MNVNPNLKTNHGFSTSNRTNALDYISEDDELNSDTDYHFSDAESDDISVT